ncbi:MAG TPA: oligosaccharide flippase family protein [Solirubrobacteraceae bacterium]|nr:oligosaccharide flippase family protein [Solirubrobacteraceae bacterium]
MSRDSDDDRGLDALGSRTIRQHVARGVVINATFLVGLGLLGFFRGFVVAGILTPEAYGIWGILVVSLGTLTRLKQIGISDKYLQQDEPDQELAFQRAFTIETLVNAALLALLVAAVPVMALVYGQPDLLLPGFALCLLVPAVTLQTPLWVLYRRMQFARQRTLEAIDPVVSFVVTIVAAIAGLSYWSFVVGALAGSWSAAAAALWAAPYPLRLTLDGASVRSYVAFSGPLALAMLSTILVAQGGVLFAELAVGLAGAGALTLASSITLLSNRVDTIVTQTLYPAICTMADRRDVLFETFVKSNRLALMWAMPFGLALALFASDLVEFVLGARWADAVVVLEVFGVVAAVGHIGFNWHAYFRARNETRPIAVAAGVQAAVFAALNVPLLFAYGLRGFAAGYIATTAAGLVIRAAYLRSLFSGFSLGRHALRALAPSVPPVAIVLLARLLDGGGRSAAVAAAELGLYIAATVASTVFFERALLREVVGYLRRRGEVAPAYR